MVWNGGDVSWSQADRGLEMAVPLTGYVKLSGKLKDLPDTGVVMQGEVEWC